jgi:hypothetical protein
MSLPKTLSFSNMRIVRQYPRSVLDLHPAFPLLSIFHSSMFSDTYLCMYSSVQIKFFIHFVVQLAACWNSALPVISIVYKLQEKAIQVVLPLGTTCAGMPSIYPYKYDAGSPALSIYCFHPS